MPLSFLHKDVFFATVVVMKRPPGDVSLARNGGTLITVAFLSREHA
jgi:hypothetical protein